MVGKILITGATGNVGREVVRELVDAGARVCAGVRDPINEQLPQMVEVRSFDFLKANTYPSALAEVDRVFLVRPPALAKVDEQFAPFIQAAAEAGVKQVVFLSVQGVEGKDFIPHAKIEALLRESPMQTTFLRAGFFMQNLSTTHRNEIRDEGKIRIPAGASKTSFIDVRDIGAVAARTLTEPGHTGQAYTLTGPQSLDYWEVAAKLSAVLGRDIVYTNPNPVAFIWRQLRTGNGFRYTMVVTALYLATRFGNAAEVHPDVPNILERPPITLDQFIEDFADCWQPSA